MVRWICRHFKSVNHLSPTLRLSGEYSAMMMSPAFRPCSILCRSWPKTVSAMYFGDASIVSMTRPERTHRPLLFSPSTVGRRHTNFPVTCAIIVVYLGLNYAYISRVYASCSSWIACANKAMASGRVRLVPSHMPSSQKRASLTQSPAVLISVCFCAIFIVFKEFHPIVPP